MARRLRNNWFALAIGSAIVVALGWHFYRPQPRLSVAGPVTFAQDVAPIVFAKCSPCHHPNEAAPFSLLTFDDVRRRARQIVDVTQKRFMPPWLPADGHGDFAGSRRLTDAELQVLVAAFFSAAATGDGAFGWEKLGRVACPPPPPSMESAYSLRTISSGTSRRAGATRPKAGITFDAADEDQISVTPTPLARVLIAARSNSAGTRNCDKPFLEANPVKIVVPAFPDSMAGSPFAGIVGVRIALDAGGSLADAWVWASSGHQAYDTAALSATRESTYTGAVSYCRPVPSEYNMVIMFDPG